MKGYKTTEQIIFNLQNRAVDYQAAIRDAQEYARAKGRELREAQSLAGERKALNNLLGIQRVLISSFHGRSKRSG